MLRLNLQLSTYPKIAINWRMSKTWATQNFIIILGIDITMIHYPVYKLNLQKYCDHNHSGNPKR